MCGKKSKTVWRLLAVYLFLLAFSLPVYSLAESSQESDPVVKVFRASEWAAVTAQFQDLQNKLALLLLTPGQQADKILSLEKLWAIAQSQQKELQATIDSLTIKLQGLEKAQTILENSWESKKIEETIAWSVAGIGWLGDIVQIVLHGLKIW